MAKIEPKYIFLDTQLFDKDHLSFQSWSISRFADLVKTGQVKVMLSEVVAGEVKRHIRRDIQEARKALHKRGGIFRNLKSTEIPPQFREEYWMKVEAEILEAFTKCCKRLKAEVLPIDPSLVGMVFDWYFSHDQPFDSEKRKAEFPDAFSIAAIKSWAEANKQPVTLISNDGAFGVASNKNGKDAPQLLTHVRSLEEFFELFPNPELAAGIKEAFSEFLDDDENFQFGEEEFRNLPFYVEDDEHMEVEGIAVAYSDPRHLHVVEAKDGKAILAGDMYVTFFAEISGLRREVERTAFVPAEISLEYTTTTPTQIVVKSVKYDTRNAIGVSLPASVLHEG